MARIRTVKPDYPKHPKVRAVSRDARLLNIHLWNLADDEGRLRELVNSIIGDVFPTDDDVTPVLLREWLSELENAGLIVRYEVDGENYIQCHDFSDHQVINKPRPSEFPPFEAGSKRSDTTTVALPDSSGNATSRNGMEREEEKEEEKEESTSTSVDSARSPDRVRQVFDHWRASYAPKAKLDAKRRGRINARLREGFSVDELKTAISNAALDPWLSGTDPNSKRSYLNSLSTLLRDAEQVERLRDFRQVKRRDSKVDAPPGEFDEAAWSRLLTELEGSLPSRVVAAVSPRGSRGGALVVRAGAGQRYADQVRSAAEAAGVPVVVEGAVS